MDKEGLGITYLNAYDILVSEKLANFEAFQRRAAGPS
jgi:hypothetical protein